MSVFRNDGVSRILGTPLFPAYPISSPQQQTVDCTGRYWTVWQLSACGGVNLLVRWRTGLRLVTHLIGLLLGVGSSAAVVDQVVDLIGRCDER